MKKRYILGIPLLLLILFIGIFFFKISNQMKVQLDAMDKTPVDILQ